MDLLRNILHTNQYKRLQACINMYIIIYIYTHDIQTSYDIYVCMMCIYIYTMHVMYEHYISTIQWNYIYIYTMIYENDDIHMYTWCDFCRIHIICDSIYVYSNIRHCMYILYIYIHFISWQHKGNIQTHLIWPVFAVSNFCSGSHPKACRLYTGQLMQDIASGVCRQI